MTTYQASRTIEPCLASILRQIDENFEVVVVDNLSTDGSQEYLKKLAEEGRLRLISTRCNRGEGRQIAAENAAGEVLIQQVDADQIYKEFLLRAVTLFEEESHVNRDVVLILKRVNRFSPFSRLPSPVSLVGKEAFLTLGGWPAINYAEDLHVFDYFHRAGLCRVVTGIDYARQTKGSPLRQVVEVVRNKKEMFDEGFTSHDVLSLTDYKGPALLVRCMLVFVAFIAHKVQPRRSKV
jgi:glycosyltransferase involved in cell wall biosynthesis